MQKTKKLRFLTLTQLLWKIFYVKLINCIFWHMYKNGSKYKAVFMSCYIMLYYAYIKNLLGVFFLFPSPCLHLYSEINRKNKWKKSDFLFWFCKLIYKCFCWCFLILISLKCNFSILWWRLLNSNLKYAAVVLNFERYDL